jgi:hypothetical protein
MCRKVRRQISAPFGGPAESRCFQLVLVDRGTLRGQTGRANLLDTRDRPDWSALQPVHNLSSMNLLAASASLKKTFEGQVWKKAAL